MYTFYRQKMSRYDFVASVLAIVSIGSFSRQLGAINRCVDGLNPIVTISSMWNI